MEDESKMLYEAIKAMLGSWGLVRGVVDTAWKEYSNRKLRNLKGYLDTSAIKFTKLSNKELERLMVSELHKEVTSIIISLRNIRRTDCGVLGNMDG